ncbi:MAG: TetR/AcrR family transcriptional regulator [Pseudomonadota bacterium]
MELLTEQGYAGTGLDKILKTAGVPKGSFYHYFESKDAFAHAVIEAYAAYFAAKLDSALSDESVLPLQRLANFIADARKGMARHGYRRGCLVGNLSQEFAGTDDVFRAQLKPIFQDWENRVAAVLAQAQKRGDISASVDPKDLAGFFWIGWEGAVLRARLVRSPAPIVLFEKSFFASLNATPEPKTHKNTKKGTSK